MEVIIVIFMLGLVAAATVALSVPQSPKTNHAATEPAALVWEAPEGGQERTIPLRNPRLTIGRDREAGLRVEGALISRRHAYVALDRPSGSWRLVDDGSTNGTYVNGQRVLQHILRDGDVVQIGRTRLRFRAPRSAPREPIIGSAAPSPVPQQRRSTSLAPEHRSPSLPRPMPPALASPPPARQAEEGDAASIPGYVLYSRMDGGHGSVFRARRVADGQECAVKVLRLHDPFLVEKFRQEVQLLVAFNHPHVVRAIGSGTVRGQPFVAMEYCGGGHLRRMMNQRQLSPEEIVRVIGQACHGVHYAHRQRVIHRDLKPEHLMFDERGLVKVVDFGIAKSGDSLTQTSHGMVLGTPAYLSPEQAKGQLIDARTDIYALGVILYEALVGRVPFTGSNTAILDQHIQRELPPPRSVAPNCDPALAAVATRALEKAPSRRYPTALAMAEALGYAPKGHQTEAPRMV